MAAIIMVMLLKSRWRIQLEYFWDMKLSLLTTAWHTFIYLWWVHTITYKFQTLNEHNHCEKYIVKTFQKNSQWTLNLIKRFGTMTVTLNPMWNWYKQSQSNSELILYDNQWHPSQAFSTKKTPTRKRYDLILSLEAFSIWDSCMISIWKHTQNGDFG